MSLPRLDEHRHSYAEYRSWPDQPRYELIDGIAYGKPDAVEMEGSVPVGILPEIVIDRDQLPAETPPLTGG